jgi:Leucine-rich repeat (LRR) protein
MTKIYSQSAAIKMLLNGKVLPGGWMFELSKIKTLFLDGNQITDPSGLAALPNLKTLSLSGNQITDPSGLAALPNLEWLSLSGNQITDPSGLAAFEHAIRNGLYISR